MKVTPRNFDTYMSVVEGAVGSPMFRHLYADVDGVKTDVTNDGDLSCAFFVSAVLSMFGTCDRIHGTVDGTVRAMLENGWKKIERPERGAVVVWESRVTDDGTSHKHIGICTGEGLAVSNSAHEKSPKIHDLLLPDMEGEARKIEAVYLHDVFRG